MRKPRAVPLTARVVDGLASMKAACSAAPTETILGIDCDHPMDKEQAQTMRNVEAAIRWIEDQQRKRELE